MKVCIYGCGAIGSLLAARLARSGIDVSAVARSAHLDAIQLNGLTLLAADGASRINAAITASDEPAELGEQDVVFLALKAHVLPEIAAAIQPLLGPNTIVVTVCNGMPWWYSFGLENDIGIRTLDNVDPGGVLWDSIRPARAIGCVVYPAARVTEPGVVQHVFGNRWAIGEPDGSMSERINNLADMLRAADFEVEAHSDIRVAIWTKLVANVAYNPVSIVTGKSLSEMIDDEATHGLLRAIMLEAAEVAKSLNIAVPVTADDLIEATRQLGNHKTSMLHDYEAGRPLELEPIVGAVAELAVLKGVATPNLMTVYQMVSKKSNEHRT